MAKFSALVRFDVAAERIHLSVGGSVEPEAADELCQLIERSVHIAGRGACVDLTGVDVTPATISAIASRCGDIAQILTDSPNAAGSRIA